MNRLSESYEDLDIEDVALVVKHTISDMSKYKDCTSTGEILEKMNEALEPYGFYLEDAEYVEPYDSYGNHLHWSTQHILYGTTKSNGLITAVVAAEDLLEDIENNYKIDWDEFMRDIITTFTHEYTHRYQLDKYPDLSGEYDNEYDYLTSNHEMAARAFAGVKELMQIGYTPKDLMGKIKSTSLDWMNESDQLSRLYDYLCCEEPNSKIMRKFKKYLYTAISKYDLDENNSDEKTHKMNHQGMIWEFNEETYVDKNLKPKGLSKYQKQGLSDDGFIDLITAKVVDDYIKGNNEVMRMWDFWDWVLDTGYGLVMCDLITSAIDKNDLEVLTFDYNLYKKMKKEIKEDAEKFVKDSGWRFDKKTQDKINKRAGKKINESEEEDVTQALTAEELNKLNNSETMIVYRSMQYINGELLPPMSAKTKLGMRKGSKLGEWEKAEEHPELANDAGYFPLNKGNGKTIMARYNPYFHCASDMLNDQFSSACDRPNMVTVECEIPVFELDSGYKAFKAKDAVGLQKWKCGIVQCQFKAKRDVYLSRYIKPIRVLSNDEVADHIVQEVAGYDITFPSNVVTPDLKEKLEARGIQFVNTNTDGIILEGDNAGKHYSKVYGGKKSKRLGESQAAYRASLVYPDDEDDFFDTYEEDVEEQLREDWDFILDAVRSIEPGVIESLRDIDINYVDTIVDRNDNERVAEFDPIQLSLNVSDIYFRLKPNLAAGVLLHELGHAVIVARYIRGGNGADLVKYAEDCKGHNQEWIDLCKQFEGCFKNVKVPITLNLSDPSIYAQTR